MREVRAGIINTILQEPRHEEIKGIALRTQSKLVVELTKLQALAQVSEAWGRERLPTPVFSPGEFHGQRRLVGYSPWGCKELDPTERRTLSLPSKATGSQPSFSSCDLLKVLVLFCFLLFSSDLTTKWIKKSLICNFAHTKRHIGERYTYRTKVWNNMQIKRT